MCRVRACTNPWHVELVGSHAQHMKVHATIRKAMKEDAGG